MREGGKTQKKNILHLITEFILDLIYFILSFLTRRITPILSIFVRTRHDLKIFAKTTANMIGSRYWLIL